MNALYILLSIVILGELVCIKQNNKIISNQNKRNKAMAQFSDIETALSNLTTAASGVATAVTTYQGTVITPAQGDTIVAGINAAVTSLDGVVSSLTASPATT